MTILMVSLLVVSLVAATLSTVQAQETTLNEQLADLARSYRGQMLEYTVAEKEYLLAVTQYQQLNTLAALEQAVVATRQASLIRDLVLITYMQQLRLHLLQTQGIEVGVKSRTLERIENMITAVQLHHDETQKVADRVQLQTVTDAFQVIVPEYEKLALFSVGIIELGRLQNAHDQTKAVFEFISDADTSHLTRLQRDQRQRSLEETSRYASQVDQEFVLEVAEWLELETNDYGQDTQSLQEVLEGLYGRVAQEQEYLKELARLTDGVSQ